MVEFQEFTLVIGWLADWKPQLTEADQHHERVLYHILLAWEKVQKLKCVFY